MNAKILLMTLFGIIALSVCSWSWWNSHLIPDMSHFNGDGRFENLSRRVGWSYYPEYRIVMPEFDLGTERRVTYSLTGIPNIGEDCYLFFCVLTPEKDRNGELPGLTRDVIAIDITDSAGRTLASINGNLRQLIRTTSSRDSFFYLYGRNGNSFVPNPKDKLVVKVDYSADDQMRGFKGFVCLESRAK
jgi:hypothetical protein